MEITYKEPKSSCLGPKIVNPSGGHPGFIRFSDIRGITIFRPCLNLEAREGGWRLRLAFAGITEKNVLTPPPRVVVTKTTTRNIDVWTVNLFFSYMYFNRLASSLADLSSFRLQFFFLERSDRHPRVSSERGLLINILIIHVQSRSIY